ncbi:MAG: hypothetical protein K6F33_01995 [Bacteroidales bacterium]|nr:hypothetical protein [Bacteroidales bacterium]
MQQNNKEYIQRAISLIETRINEYKNQYPHNMADCWRKRAPFLILAIIIPTFMVVMGTNSESLGILLILAMPIIMILSIITIIRNYQKGKNGYLNFRNIDMETTAMRSVAALDQAMQHPDISQYRERCIKTIEDVSERKKRMRTKANVLCIIITIGISILGFALTGSKDHNNNFALLNIENFSTYDTEPYTTEAGGNCQVTSHKCYIKIEDFWSDNSVSNPNDYFQLRIQGLQISNAADNDIFALRLVDPQSGTAIPGISQFTFYGRQLNDADGIITKNYSDYDDYENFCTMRHIRDGVKFVVSKMN